MSFTVKLIEKPGYLQFVITGSFELQDSIDTFSQIVSECLEKNMFNTLVDMSNLETFPSTSEIIKLSEKVIDIHDLFVPFSNRAMRIAVLTTPTRTASGTPGMDLANSRGFPMLVTSELEEALAWLLGSHCLT